MWSQAIAAAIVGLVVTAYSLTSALGHAALNRTDTTGKREIAADTYKNMQADLKRAKEQLSWIPQHRPEAAVQSEIDNLKNESAWNWTKGCTVVTGPKGRSYCQQFNDLMAERANSHRAKELESQIAEVSTKLADSKGLAAASNADPQAAVLAKLASFFMADVKVQDVQTALTIFIALLLEVGSAFGMYIAFSQWRLYDAFAPAAPKMATVASTAAAAVADPVDVPEPARISKPRSGANDNKVAPKTKTKKLIAPETDVERFYKENVETQDGSSLTATALYEEYCAWCEEQQKEPLALPTFGREFGELGVQKAKVAGRVRYIGIALRSGLEAAEDKKLPAFRARAA